jgi:hypothetical protein
VTVLAVSGIPSPPFTGPLTDVFPMEKHPSLTVGKASGKKPLAKVMEASWKVKRERENVKNQMQTRNNNITSKSFSSNTSKRKEKVEVEGLSFFQTTTTRLPDLHSILPSIPL